jgi:NAD(P)-dependent dehydrogenase (short-subunit alcohol dehydrogenase family)
MTTLQYKTALVTGASRGIGRATAVALAEAGAHVLVHYGRSAQEAESLVTAIQTKGGRANAISSDLGTPNGAALLAKQVRSIIDRLDVLVLNAGISKAARIADYTIEDFDNLFATNVRGPFFLVQQFLPVFGEGSSIIVISSAVARTVVGKPSLEGPSILAYASTKGALEPLVKNWAAILGPCGIRVNAVAPGVIDTDMSNFTKTGPGREVTLGLQALKRIGKPEDIADVVAFVASDGAPLDHRCQYSRRWRFEALTGNLRSAMHTSSTKGKEIRIPGPDHPIAISPAEGKVRVRVAGMIVGDSTRALRLEEKGDTCLLLAAQRCRHVLARSDQTLYLLSVQGRLHLLQHSHWRSEIGICRLDVRKAV